AGFFHFTPCKGLIRGLRFLGLLFGFSEVLYQVERVTVAFQEVRVVTALTKLGDFPGDAFATVVLGTQFFTDLIPSHLFDPNNLFIERIKREIYLFNPSKGLASPFVINPHFMEYRRKREVVEPDHVGGWARHQIEREHLDISTRFPDRPA